MNVFFVAFLLAVLTACNKKCEDTRSFSPWLFQQTWFTTQAGGKDHIGGLFGDSTGEIVAPRKIGDFDYCAKGMTLYLTQRNVWHTRQEIKILALDKESMTLQFEDKTIFKYYRAGR